jgi:hypothetical protein
MNAKILLCSLKRIPMMTRVKNTCFRILPYVFCALLLLTSSCFWRFDRDGGHDGGHDRDQDQHHDHEGYDRQHERERDRNGMNLKHEQYPRNEVSGQGEENRGYTPADESRDQS